MTVEKNKQYRTYDGRDVRIYSTDGGVPYHVHGAILFDGGWEMQTWTMKGKAFLHEECGSDLIEVKPRIKREVWVNVYEGVDCWAMHTCKEDADRGAMRSRLACVKLTIDCEEGEGL